MTVEVIRHCVDCGAEILIRRKRPITPADEKDVRKYCSACRGKRMRGKPPTNARPEERYVNSQGYVYILLDGIHIPEHRYVMEQKLGRKLEKGEVVHHIDGNKTNNRPENLSLYKLSGFHTRDHFLGKSVSRKKKRGKV